MLASRKRRRQVSDDPLRDSAVEPRAPVTPPKKLSESVTITDVNQSDIKRAHTDQLKTQQCFCVNVSKLENEKNVTASVVKINQSYQDHVGALRSRPACYMLSDTEYSDFDESDEDEDWAEYRQNLQDYINSSRSSKEPAQMDIHIVTDEEKRNKESKLRHHGVQLMCFNIV